MALWQVDIHLLKNMSDFPLLVLKGTYDYNTEHMLTVSRGLKQMEEDQVRSVSCHDGGVALACCFFSARSLLEPWDVCLFTVL